MKMKFINLFGWIGCGCVVYAGYLVHPAIAWLIAGVLFLAVAGFAADQIKKAKR